MEITYDVKVVRKDYMCPKCMTGWLRPTGVTNFIIGTSSTLYEHKCTNPNCNYTELFDKLYPYIDYEPIVNTNF